MTQATAFIFPGQGSQTVGMLGDLAQSHTQIQHTFEIASNVLGYDLWEVCQTDPNSQLNQTEFTQPALLTAGVALWNCLDDPKPSVLAGHSLGEYTALVCAKSLAFEDAVSLVRDRGRFMQQALSADQGAMAAIIGLDDQRVAELCEQHAQGSVVTPANFNSPGQVVIAGVAEAVDRVVQAASDAGARLAKRLSVSVPSHCDLMRPAAQLLAERLNDIALQAPSIPVIHNVDAKVCEDPNAIKHRLVDQLYSPVRWVDCIDTIKSMGVTCFFECGPGKVLTGLNKRIDKTFTHLSFEQIKE